MADQRQASLTNERVNEQRVPPRRIPPDDELLDDIHGSNGLIYNLEGYNPKMYLDSAGLETIGVGHKLTDEEKASGSLMIGGVAVPWRPGLSDEQVKALHEQDWKTANDFYDRHVTVKLGPRQKEAILSFFYQTGRLTLTGKRETLTALNSGDFNAFFDRHQKWNRAGGKYDYGVQVRRAKERAWFNLDPWDPEGKLTHGDMST